jgi:hypothetical protein
MVSIDASDRWSTGPRVYALWAGVLLAPIAWALQLTIAYAMADSVCTAPGTILYYVLTGGALAAATAGGVIAWRVRQQPYDTSEEAADSVGRGRFMALSGMLLSLVFGLAIVAQTIPLLMLPPCR